MIEIEIEIEIISDLEILGFFLTIMYHGRDFQVGLLGFLRVTGWGII
jgi:hypothetical protein